MHYIEVVSLRRGSDRDSTLTYQSDAAIAIGSIVKIPFGKQSTHGVVVDSSAQKPDFATKPVTEIIRPAAVPKQLIKTLFWLAAFYATPLNSVFSLALPKGVEKKRRGHRQSAASVARPAQKISLTADQQAAISSIQQQPDATHLLQGVTGSGKTQVYIELADRALAAGKSVIVLVPEIALTTQIVGDFQNRFERVIVTHSGMSESQRHSAWDDLADGPPAVLIGPRSALFAPLKNLGLIVIDECHEGTYKQDTAPRYDARRVARLLAAEHGALFVMGSATPTVVDHYVAAKRGQIHRLPKPIAQNGHSKMIVVDSTKRDNFLSSQIISNQLLEELRRTTSAKQQSLIFHNRRGTATIGLCTDCGWTAQCPNCEVPLTLHKDTHELKCHICAHTETPPSACPDCGKADILFRGYGTKRVVEEINKLLPGATVARFDADNTKEETLAARYQEVHDGDYDIVVGTQIVAKGLDLPKLQTVGVISAESSLHLPDFAATERTFQLLTQVAGRAGRRAQSASVIMQTSQPNSHLLRMVSANNYDGFYEHEIAQREQLLYPPFVYLLQLTCSYASRLAAQQAAEKKLGELRKTAGVMVLGPAPAFYEKRAGRYRWTLVVKSRRRDRLQHLALEHTDRYWTAELDPVSLLT